MPKELYLLDTVNCVRNYDPFMDNYLTHPYHSFNVLFPLKSPLRNLKSISLKSVEMPFTLFTTRSMNNSYKIDITFTYGSFDNVKLPIVLAEKQFADIAALLTLINSQITAQLASYTGVSISFQTMKTLYNNDVCKIAHNCVSLAIENNPLTFDILGYTNRFSASNSVALISNSPMNINAIDTCLYMNISNLPIMNNNIQKNSTFKIPLSTYDISNNILYYKDNYENQAIYFNNSNFTLDKINIVVYDRYGTQLIGYNNWSLTLLIEYEDDNNNQIEYLNINN